MRTQNVDWRLSYDERVQARQNGVNQAIIEGLGANTEKLDILTARNVRHITRDGIFGLMEVTVEWTEPDGHWHWHSLRFNGEKDIDLSEEHLTILGKFACDRPTDVKDFTYQQYGGRTPVLQPRPTADIVPLPEQPAVELIPMQPSEPAAETVAA